LLYVLNISTPKTFQELATNASDMEMITTNHPGKASSAAEIRKHKGDINKNSRSCKSSTEESDERTDSDFRKAKSLGKVALINERCWEEACSIEKDFGKQV